MAAVRPTLSIVIPTHKRASILQLCIDHLEKQTIAGQIEVIIVSDGPDVETRKIIEKHKNEWNIPVSYFEIEKSQQGKARNFGIDKARGEYALFIGDDIFLEPDACEKHLEAHKKNEARNEQRATRPIAVLGFTTWDPAVGITETMKWLEKSGWQFGYPLIHAHRHAFIPVEIQHSFTYTSNISLPMEVARKHAFLERIKHYGWEDIEWGHRLKIGGVKLYYQPDAKALHHHRIDLYASLKRMETLGQSLNHIEKHLGGLKLRPAGLKLFAYKIAGMLPTLSGRHRAAFLKGLTGPENLH